MKYSFLHRFQRYFGNSKDLHIIVVISCFNSSLLELHLVFNLQFMELISNAWWINNGFFNKSSTSPFTVDSFKGLEFSVVLQGVQRAGASCYVTCLFDWTGGKESLDFRGGSLLLWVSVHLGHWSACHYTATIQT